VPPIDYFKHVIFELQNKGSSDGMGGCGSGVSTINILQQQTLQNMPNQSILLSATSSASTTTTTNTTTTKTTNNTSATSSTASTSLPRPSVKGLLKRFDEVNIK